MEKKSNGLKIIIILLVLILIATLVVGFLYIRKKEKAGGVEAAKPIDENTYQLEEFLVNLKSEGNIPSYLKIKIALMYPNKKDETKLEENVDKIRDIINDQLRVRTSKQVLDTDKVQELKTHMIGAINESLGKEVVLDVYFTDIVVQ